MTERASIFQGVQVGVETVAGTAVAATKKLQSIGIEPAIKVDVQTFRPMGNKFKTVAALGKEWVSAKLSGALTYTEIVYLLSSILGYAAPAQQGGTTAYKWTHAIDSSDPDVVKTFTVEQGGKVRAHKFTNGLVTALGLSFSRNGIEVSGEMIGKALSDDIHMSTNATYTLTANATPPTSGTFTLTYSGQTTSGIAFDATAVAVQAALVALSNIGANDVEVTATVAGGAGNLSVANNVYTIEFTNDLGQQPITLTGTFTGLTASGSIAIAAGTVGVTPTELDLVPVLPTQIDVSLSTAQSTLGAATPLSRVLSADWNISDRFGPLFPLRSTNGTGFATTIETEPNLEAKLKMEADSEGMALLTTLRAGSTTFLRILATGATIASIYTYQIQIDTALKVTDVSEFSDEDGVYAIEWTMVGAHDATWGKAVQVDVINTLTGL